MATTANGMLKRKRVCYSAEYRTKALALADKTEKDTNLEKPQRTSRRN